MAVNLGSTPIANIYIGNTQIQNVYLGNSLIYSAGNAIQTIIDNFKTRVANDGGTFEAESNLLSILNSVDSSIGLSKVNMLLTPNAFKTGKAYNVIGSTDFAMSRNTTATRFNSAGILVNSPINIMRIDYSSGTPMILDEVQATNLQTFSNDFNNAAWSKSNFVQNALTTTSIDGTTILGYDFGLGFIFKDYPSSAGTSYSNSFYIKGNKNATVVGRNPNGSTINVPITTDWVRIIDTGVSAASTNRMILDNRVTAVADLKVFLYGFQGELPPSSSFIPTTSAAVTRNADVLTVTPPAGTVRITTTFLDNTTQVLNTIPATFTLPTGQTRQVVFQNSL